VFPQDRNRGLPQRRSCAAAPQLPVVLVRPTRLGHAHVNAEHWASVARPRPHAQHAPPRVGGRSTTPPRALVLHPHRVFADRLPKRRVLLPTQSAALLSSLVLVNAASYRTVLVALALIQSAELYAQPSLPTMPANPMTSPRRQWVSVWQRLGEGLAYLRRTPALLLP
jgi:hypothetical protein